MEKVNVAFNGMSRVPDDAVARDGDMAVLVNMRLKDGELTRTSYPEKKNTMIQGGVKMAKWHGDKLLELRADGALRVADTETYINNGYVVNTFEVMGNVVCMYTEDNVLYSIYRNKEYVFLGELPLSINMDIDYIEIISRASGEEKYESTLQTEESQNEKFYKYHRKGWLDKCLDDIYRNRSYVDIAEFVLALKLFDGSYIVCSPIYNVNACKNTTSAYIASNGLQNFRFTSKEGGLSKYTASVAGFIPEFKLQEYDLSDWADIISSVCLFSSGSLPIHKVGQGAVIYSYNGNILTKPYEDYLPMMPDEIENRLTEFVFYKIAEYDLKGNRLSFVDSTSPSYLSVQDKLIINSYDKIVSKKSYVYNSRLHFAENEIILNNGFIDTAPSNEYEYAKKIVVKTYVKTRDGEKSVVCSEVYNDYRTLSGLLTHYDARAYRKDVYVHKKVSGGSAERYGVYFKSFELKQHPSRNMSFYVDDKYKNVVSFEIKSELGYNVRITNEKGLLEYWGYPDATDKYYTFKYNKAKDYWVMGGSDVFNMELYFDIEGVPVDGDSFKVYIKSRQPNNLISEKDFEGASSGVDRFYDADVEWEVYRDGTVGVKDFTVAEGDIKEKISGVLRVSAVDNPFYFPTAQTYKFGGEIMGMASNAEAISTGQFGQYPLFVFAKDGIWAMAVDTSGKGAYVSQSTFAREVCNGGVCPVSGGVVFTTDKGVMAISGGGVVELSAQIDGAKALFADSGLYDEIFTVAGIGSVKPGEFREFVKNAKVGYNYQRGEVLICNPEYGYTYVYSLDSKGWYVIDLKLNYPVLGGKDLIVYGDYWRYTFKEGNERGPVVAITRPVKMGSLGYKRLRQAALRCTFNGDLGFYVLGSDDGVNFVCITGKEHRGNEWHRDLVTTMSRSRQFKYFALAVAGNMEGRISMAELLVDNSFTNGKLK